MTPLDPSLPIFPGSGRDRTDDLRSLARTTVDPHPGSDAALDDLGVTRVTEPLTDSPELTPPGGLPVPLNKPIVGSALGEFELIDKLGEGAMGAVYRARQTGFNRIVALKVLFSHIAKQPRLVERLYREGRALAQLDHEGIVQAYGVGEVSGCHYVAMEFVDGSNLQHWLRRIGKFTVADALAITLAVARALGHAHSQGIIHRDVKPENILISPEGQVKVADFGMVKTDDEDMALTQTGHAIGTPWYMPLEQAKNAKETDVRSDIYALGCMLYCLLTGHPPFQGRTLVELIQAKERGTFPPARSQNPDVPERLELILLKMIAKVPAQRYPNCADVIRDLEKLGLASSRLSFLGTTDESRYATPRPQGTKTLIDRADPNPNIWFVKLPASPGKHTVKKLTTEQLRVMLASGKIKPITQVSRESKGGYRALSAYKEFGMALSQVTREAADGTTSKYRQLYKKIEEIEQVRENRADEQRADKESHALYYLEIAWAYGKWLLLAGGIAGFVTLLANAF